MPQLTIVDDEPVSLDVLMRAARLQNYDCQGARTAEEALALLEKQVTPIVVTDLRMPGQGGAWLVREIQRRWPHVSIIVVTAGQDQESINQCLEAGAHQFFLKPVHFDEFHRALDIHLRSYYSRQERDRYRRRLERKLARKTRELRTTYISAIHSLVRTLEARDLYVSGHSMRVRSYAIRFAKKLNLNDKQKRQLSLAAKLHDIGKVGLPEGILNKPASLTPLEFEAVKEHPVMGERILTPIIRNRDILAAIRGHHERFNGLGYPDGLAREDIPFFARILTIADSYDAMTSCRAYRAAMSSAEALDRLRAGSGTQFDPALVAVFLELVAEIGERGVSTH